MRKLLFYSQLLFLLLLASCVESPNKPEYNKKVADTLSVKFPQSGAVVLCEGLWHYGNSDIYIYDKETHKITDSYFKTATGSYLGDNVSGVLFTGNNKIIFVAGGTRQLIYMNYSIPAVINKIDISYDRAAPREIAQIGNRYYYTDLYRDEVHSGIIGDTLSAPDEVYETGAAPEDIIAYSGKLYIANSGFGDYRQKEENAGSLQILDPTTGESQFIYIGPNLIQLAINENEGYIACGYLNTPSAVQKGGMGGIVFVDLKTNNIMRKLEVKDFTDLAVSEKTGRIYYLAEGGLTMLSSVYSKAIPQIITPNKSKDIWYSLSMNEANELLWIGNARDYQSDGEVIAVNQDGAIITRFDVGKNPRKVWFY